MAIIEELLTIPRECKIDYVIPKTQIHREGELKNRDKQLFTNYVEQIKWLYKFDETNTGIKTYNDDQREYLEVEVINVHLKEDKLRMRINGELKQEDKIERIATLIFRFIPYPIILVFEYNDLIKFYGTHIKDSLQDSEKITLDEMISTNWIDTFEIGELSQYFIDNIQLENLNHENFYEFYNNYITSIIQYEGSLEVGKPVTLEISEIKELYSEIDKIDAKMQELKNEIDKESQFRRQVELNMKASQLNKEKQKLIEKLAK